MDPADVQAAFKLAYSVSSPQDRTAIRDAYMRWANTGDPGSGALRARSPLKAAVGCACRSGGVELGALLVGAAAEVSIEQTVAEAEAKIGRQLTDEERAAILAAAASAQAGESEESTLAWLAKYTPPGIAYQVAVETAARVRAARDEVVSNAKGGIAAAAAEAERIAAEQARKARELLDKLHDRSSKTALVMVGSALAVAAFGLYLYAPSKGSARRAGAA